MVAVTMGQPMKKNYFKNIAATSQLRKIIQAKSYVSDKNLTKVS